jgi:hypothetical protein
MIVKIPCGRAATARFLVVASMTEQLKRSSKRKYCLKKSAKHNKRKRKIIKQ